MKDKIQSKLTEMMKIPELHGHTEIILKNVETGEEEIHEKDNLVTNAVANIFASNLYGIMDYASMTPMRNFGSFIIRPIRDGWHMRR